MGYCLFTLLSCVNGLGLVQDMESDVEEAVEVVARLTEEYGESTTTEDNPGEEPGLAANGRFDCGLRR